MENEMCVACKRVDECTCIHLHPAVGYFLLGIAGSLAVATIGMYIYQLIRM